MSGVSFQIVRVYNEQVENPCKPTCNGLDFQEEICCNQLYEQYALFDLQKNFVSWLAQRLDCEPKTKNSVGG